MRTKKGFSLIEILLILVIISILAGLFLYIANPGRQVAQTNNAQRRLNVHDVLNAVYNYSAANNGALPIGILNTPTYIGSGTDQVDICSELVPDYLRTLPFDPIAPDSNYTDCSDYDTGYTISVDSISGYLTVDAPFAELSETISFTR